MKKRKDKIIMIAKVIVIVVIEVARTIICDRLPKVMLCSGQERRRKIMDAEKSIPSPKEIHKYFGGLFDEEEVEQLVALWINEGGKIIDVETISRGTASFTSAHPEDIFRRSLCTV